MKPVKGQDLLHRHFTDSCGHFLVPFFQPTLNTWHQDISDWPLAGCSGMHGWKEAVKTWYGILLMLKRSLINIVQFFVCTALVHAGAYIIWNQCRHSCNLCGRDLQECSCLNGRFFFPGLALQMRAGKPLTSLNGIKCCSCGLQKSFSS